MGRYQCGDYVKVAFTHEESGETERMWVKVDYSDDQAKMVFGRLDSEPIFNTDIKLGQELAVSYENVREHSCFPG